MQVDYIDYYLLHMIGGGGMEQFRKRYIDNGMIDFLVKEREAGRIRRLGWSFHGDIEVYDYALQMHDRGEVHWDFVQIQLNYVDWKHAWAATSRQSICMTSWPKRKIPAVHYGASAGWAALQCPRPYCGTAEAARTRTQCGVLGIPLCRFSPGCTDSAEWHDLYGTFAG